MPTGDAEILTRLEEAVRLFGEAQNAYDFRAFGQAQEMAERATLRLREAFDNSRLLRENFPVIQSLLSRGDDKVEFSHADLEKAYRLLRKHEG